MPSELQPEQVELIWEASRWRRGRRRRSENQHGHLFVSLPAFNRELYLELQRDEAFLADSFMVEERSRGESIQHEPDFKGRVCFYTGNVFNHTDSFASLDTCGGLVSKKVYCISGPQHLSAFQRCVQISIITFMSKDVFKSFWSLPQF